MWVSGNPTVVTVTQGGNTYTAAVEALPDNFAGQTATYSLSGVPAGTYSAKVAVTSTAFAVDIFSVSLNTVQQNCAVVKSGPSNGL